MAANATPLPSSPTKDMALLLLAPAEPRLHNYVGGMELNSSRKYTFFFYNHNTKGIFCLTKLASLCDGATAMVNKQRVTKAIYLNFCMASDTLPQKHPCLQNVIFELDMDLKSGLFGRSIIGGQTHAGNQNQCPGGADDK